MRSISYFFFYTYIGLVCLAGLWGAFGLARLDFSLLMQADLAVLTDRAEVNVLSQYRFLRALELGFGLFALSCVREIFNERKFNQLFLSIMGMGFLARAVSLFYEGMPNGMMLFFMLYELAGLILIFIYTRQTIRDYAPA